MWFVGAAKRAAIIALIVAGIMPVLADAASTTVTANVCRASIDPTTLATTTPNPTTAPTADLTGTAEPNVAVDITDNGASIATVLADSTGNFGVTVGLALGDNHLKAIGTDACGHQTTSPELLLTRNPVPPPAPTIFQPQSGDTITTEQLLVSGQTEGLATVTIYVEDQVVATLTADESGAFATTIPLALGLNHLQISSTNSAGTGPRTAIITVTRAMPAATPAATPTPAPSFAALAAPVILSPSNDVTTSASSVLLTIQAAPGSIVEIYRGNDLWYALNTDSSGVLKLEAAQSIGTNTWTARANQSGTRSPRSNPVTITRLPTPLAAPTISSPSDNTTLTEPWAEISGTAEPASTIRLYAGRRVIAQLIAGETGTFKVRIPIKSGANAVYAEATRDNVSRRSSVIVLSYTAPGLASGFAQTALSIGRTVIGSVLGAAIILTQATADLVGRVSGNPSLVTLVLGLALVTLTFTQGLIGFELLLMLLPFIRWWWRLIEQPSSEHVLVNVTDAVTGRPLPFVLATIKSPRNYTAISDFAGHLHLPSHLAAGAFKLSRPGYHSLGLTGKESVALEPIPGAANLRTLILDAILGLLAWLLLLLATLTSFVLAYTQPSLLASLSAIAFAMLLVVNVLLLASHTRAKWGRLTDAHTGRLLANALVELKSADGTTASQYQTQADGRYTLCAPVGEYDIVITSASHQSYREHISVRWREAYLGFNLKLHHK